MNKTTTTLAAATLLVLAACDGADHDDEHGHDDHGHAEHSHDAPAAAPAPTGPVEVTSGALKVRLEPAADAIRLQITGADGQPVSPTEEARVVLTGTDEQQQRVVLQPDGSGWSGAAKAAGAPGYIAVVSFKHGGQDESVRLTWGDVPAPAPAPAPEPAADDHGDDGDHGHGHGHGH